uniref:Serine and arginine rich splicing factor 6 n=1 Tax=Taeniopygia guttata TaxID=59729 RepID=A0A674GTJ6_TAEGU
MRQAGEVTYADAHKERTNEGVIEFRSYSDMKRALDKLDGTEINGRKIRLVEDKPRSSHRRSYSGSRSRSRSRRRSRSRSRRSRSSRSRSRSVSKSRSRLNPGHEAKTAPVPDRKAGSPDQRANPNPSLTGVHARTADPRRSLRSPGPDPGPGLDLPKKMVKGMLSLSPGPGAGLAPTRRSSSRLQRLAPSRRPKELRPGPAPGLAQSPAHDRDPVQEIRTTSLLSPCTLTEHFPTCQAISVMLVLQKLGFLLAGVNGLRTKA